MRQGLAERFRLGFSPRGQEKVVALIQCYLDESGIHSGANHCVIAGYVGSTEQWGVFERSWEAHSDPPFHGKLFFGRKGGKRVPPYEDWTDRQAAEYLDGMIGAIGAAGVMEVGAVVDVKAFFELTAEERKYLTGGVQRSERKWVPTGKPSAAYYLPFQLIIPEAIDVAEKIEPGAKVHFVFDCQDVLSPYALILYAHIKKNMPEWGGRMGSLDFADDEDETPLQAADMSAHCWYRESGPAPHEEMRRARASQSHSLPLLNKEMLRLLLLHKDQGHFDESRAPA